MNSDLFGSAPWTVDIGQSVRRPRLKENLEGRRLSQSSQWLQVLRLWGLFLSPVAKAGVAAVGAQVVYSVTVCTRGFSNLCVASGALRVSVAAVPVPHL